MNPLTLNVENLGKRFGDNRVFSDLSFSHSEGVMGIAGPNGSGKSTLLQCLAGLMRPQTGQIHWLQNGDEIDPETLRQRLGFAAPYINLYEELTCRENLAFLIRLRYQSVSEEQIEEALGRSEILHLDDRLYGKLSTGQQQRLRLAAALVHQPDILFLDEPGSNLDESGRTVIASVVTEFREQNKLVVLASNNPDELNLCDRVFSMEKETVI